MKTTLDDSVFGSLDGNLEIRPFLPELLQDLWSLGSPPERSIALLKPLDLPPAATRVLDLGCGKGAVTVRLAAELGFSAVGVDGCAEFLETARAKAGEFGVGSRCQFVLGDLREYVKKACDFDVAILAYVGDVLGGPRETVGRLRTCVRDGGYILIDDGYLRSGRVFHHYRPHDETVTELLSFGDVLLKEIENTDDEIMEINRSYLRDIRERARGLAARRPGLGPLLKAYLKSQEEECALLTRHFRGATWLVRKGGGKNSKRMA